MGWWRGRLSTGEPQMARDYKPDYSVRLSEESEHKSLYSWCLREFDKDGKQTGID